MMLSEPDRNYLRGFTLARQSIGKGPLMKPLDVAHWAWLLIKIPIRDMETQGLLDGLLSTGVDLRLASEPVPREALLPPLFE